jgi:hypothetical protein
MGDKVEQRVYIKFYLKCGKSTTKTLEILHEAFGARQLFLNGIHISIPVKCQLKMNFQGYQAPAKQQKMLKKFENSSTKTIAEQSMISQTPLGSVLEFARSS